MTSIRNVVTYAWDPGPEMTSSMNSHVLPMMKRTTILRERVTSRRASILQAPHRPLRLSPPSSLIYNPVPSAPWHSLPLLLTHLPFRHSRFRPQVRTRTRLRAHKRKYPPRATCSGNRRCAIGYRVSPARKRARSSRCTVKRNVRRVVGVGTRQASPLLLPPS